MTVVQQSATDFLNEGMMNYSSYTLLNRAIPILQDGLKPSQRRIIYTYYMNKINHFKKSFTVTGLVAAIHPHGDPYDTVVGMDQLDKNSVPLIDGRGSWGQFTSNDLEAAAERYTETKISDFGIEMTKHLKDGVVETTPNYDGTIDVPVVIPVTFPLVLLYYAQGTGVGFASEKLPFNMQEIADLMHSMVIDGVKKPIYPDFPTGGEIIVDDKALNEILTTGSGSLQLRAKMHKIDDRTISITEIPYGTKREKIIDKIFDLIKTQRLPEVKLAKDLTGYNGLNIELTTKRSVDFDMLKAKLYKLTPLESAVHSNSNLIDLETGLPAVMGAYEIINRWMKWRIPIYKKTLENEIATLSKKAHLLNGLGSILKDVDKAINIIRTTSRNVLNKTLQDEFKLDSQQCEYVINMRLYNINPENIQNQIKEIDNINNLVQNKTELLNDESAIKHAIIDEVEDVANRFGKSRKTKIVKPSQEEQKTTEKLNQIKDSAAAWVVITKEGYAFKSSNKPDLSKIELKPGDTVANIYELTEGSTIELISSDTNMYGVPVSTIDKGLKKLGTFLPQLSDYDVGEILFTLPKGGAYDRVIYGYDNGRVSLWSTDNISAQRKKTVKAWNLKQNLTFVLPLKKGESQASIELYNKSYQNDISSDDLSLKQSRYSTGSYQTGQKRLKVEYRIKG